MVNVYNNCNTKSSNTIDQYTQTVDQFSSPQVSPETNDLVNGIPSTEPALDTNSPMNQMSICSMCNETFFDLQQLNSHYEFVHQMPSLLDMPNASLTSQPDADSAVQTDSMDM